MDHHNIQGKENIVILTALLSIAGKFLGLTIATETVQ